jgi:hypothetical protein
MDPQAGVAMGAGEEEVKRVVLTDHMVKELDLAVAMVMPSLEHMREGPNGRM